MMLKVSDFDGLRSYLIERSFGNRPEEIRIERLDGGVSNEVLKITTTQITAVLKQPLRKLKVKEEWMSDISRAYTEKECLKLLNRMMPDCVPRLLFEDDENYLFMMEYIPERFRNWKQSLMQGECDEALAASIARTLAYIHQATHEHPVVVEKFGSKRIFEELRINPYFRSIQERHNQLTEEIDQEIERCMNTAQALVTADFSPKNILVGSDSSFYLLDFEVAHYGDPTFDLGFLTTHFVLKSIWNPMLAANYHRMLQTIVDSYFENVPTTERQTWERHAVRHLGFLLLARVDGKSPVEYVTSEDDKRHIRQISYAIVKDQIGTFSNVVALLTETLKRWTL